MHIHSTETCLVDNDFDYPNNDVFPSGGQGHDMESCRTHCKTLSGANYFSLSSAWGCSCKSSANGRTPQAGTVSGELWCNTSGEIQTQNIQIKNEFSKSNNQNCTISILGLKKRDTNEGETGTTVTGSTGTTQTGTTPNGPTGTTQRGTTSTGPTGTMQIDFTATGSTGTTQTDTTATGQILQVV